MRSFTHSAAGHRNGAALLPQRPSALLSPGTARGQSRAADRLSSATTLVLVSSSSRDDARLVQEGLWTPREQVLVSELIATRKQVDRLLENQQVLMNMLSASLAAGSWPHPQPGSVPAPLQQATLPATLAAPAAGPLVQPPAAAASHAQARQPAGTEQQQLTAGPSAPASPVTQILSAAGAVRPSDALATPSQAAPGIQGALRLASDGDVLAEDVPLGAQDAGISGAAPPQRPSAPATAELEGLQLPILVPRVRSSWWMERLHVALLARGYYAGDDDVQSWTFGEGTGKALTGFQADQGLPVTGVSDAASWAALLSELPDLAQDIRTAVQEGSAPPWPGAVGTQLPPPGGKQQSAEQQRGQAAPSTAVAAPSASSSAPSSLNGAKPAAPASSSSASSAGTVTAPGTGQSFSKGTAFFSSSAPSSSSLPFNPSFAPMEGEEPMPLDALDAYYMSAGQEGDASDRAGGSVPPKTAVNNRPPAMEEGDVGGFFMETLHAALLRSGFDPTFREMDRAEFGVNTTVAVKGFQVARHLPGTGRVDDATWALLLKDEADLRTAFISAVALGGGGGASAAPPAPAPEVQNGVVPAGAPGSTNGVVAPHSGAAPSAQHAPTEPPRSSAAAPAASSSSSPAAGAEPGSQARSAGGLRSLVFGDDDIQWVAWLHRALVAKGFHPSEEECEDWLFGEGTQEAVLTAQASGGLPETGVVCAETWQLLLRDTPDSELLREVEQAAGSALSTWSSAGGSKQAAAPVASTSGADAPPSSGSASAASSAAAAASSAFWPVVMEGDGGKHVAVLQRALEAAGFHCGEDEPQWWQCGSDTINALRTFQACSSLSETGVCDSATWKALAQAVGAAAESIDDLTAHIQEKHGLDGADGGESDLGTPQEGRVWLLGEQRWEVRRPGSSSTGSTDT